MAGRPFCKYVPNLFGFRDEKRVKFTQVAGLNSLATLKPIASGIVIAFRGQQLIHGRSRNPHQVTLYGLLSHKSHRCHLHDKRILLQIKYCNVLLVQSFLYQNLISYYLLNTNHMNIMTPLEYTPQIDFSFMGVTRNYVSPSLSHIFLLNL